MSAKHIVIDARIRPSSTGRYMDRLLEHLQAIDQENRYTILLKPGDSWQPSASNFSTLVCEYKQFSFNLLDQFTFAKYLRNLKPDLVHFGMTPQEPVFYSGTRITTTHDLTMFRYARPGRLPAWLHALRMIGYRWLFKQSVKKASRIIVPTEFVKNDLIKFRPGVANKIIVTYEASEPPLPVQEQKPNIEVERFILYVGSAFPHKNLDKLVDAFGLLAAKDPSLRLVMAGKKELYYNQLDTYISTKPYAKQIITPGFVSDEELKWLYTHAAAYVFPSLSEGFGLPGLEAMAHGCPVVSSNATCLPEVYGDAALYFDPNNIEEMAHRISEVIDHPTLANDLKVKGVEQLKKYSWRRMAEQTLEVYKSVLGN